MEPFLEVLATLRPEWHPPQIIPTVGAAFLPRVAPWRTLLQD